MANTGIKQATVAYKVSRYSGEALDINGNPTRLSGLKQAIALLTGFPNPNPALYEVELYYTALNTVEGNPTTKYDISACPIGGNPVWILTTGVWNGSGFWTSSGVWNY